MLALLLAIVAFMASLSEPALRLPLVAAATFAAMFLARVSPLGPVLFGAGFIIAYGLTLGDGVLGLALQPGTVGNTTGAGLPQLAFMPPEEALVHVLLWLAAAVALPAAVVAVGNLLSGRDPALLLRAALAARLEASARVCAGEPGAERALAALAREGTGGAARAGAAVPAAARRAACPAARPGADRGGRRAGAGAARHRARARRLAARRPGGGGAPAGRGGGLRARGPAAAGRLPCRSRTRPGRRGRWPRRCGAGWRRCATRCPRRRTSRRPPPGRAKPARRLLAADAWSNPAHVRFALKVTLAMMLCYGIEDLANWPGIHTCVITCFFVSLGTVGETVHKMMLRLAGCVVGGALGIAVILVLMPLMTDLGELLLVLGALTFLAAWIGSGGERTAYAGLQIGLAVFIAVLQGSGPTLDMETARDRLIGIALGDVVVSAVFVTLWPVGVATVVRGGLARALEQLAAMLDRPGPDSPGADAAAARRAFGAAVAQARAVLVNAPYEAGLPRRGDRRPVDRTTLLDVQALMLPVSVLLALRDDPAWRDVPSPARDAVAAHHRALAGWLRRCAAWTRDGTGAEQVAAGPPPPPAAPGRPADPGAERLAAWAAWQAVLHGDLRAILDRVGPSPRPAAAVATGGAALAAT